MLHIGNITRNIGSEEGHWLAELYHVYLPAFGYLSKAERGCALNPPTLNRVRTLFTEVRTLHCLTLFCLILTL